MSMREDIQKSVEAARHFETRGVMPTWARVALVGAMLKHGDKLLIAADQLFGPLTGKYGAFLAPFVALMERELHANSGKGDREGWLSMSPETAILEIHHHVAKLQKAILNRDIDGIREYAADVANMAMMSVDVMCLLDVHSTGDQEVPGHG